MIPAHWFRMVLAAIAPLVAVAGTSQTFVEDFGSWRTSGSRSSLWHEDFNVEGVIDDTSPFCPGVPFVARQTPNGWTADNGMFVCESFTNVERGMSLSLEGGGRGTVALQDLPAGDVPNGIGTIDFSARVVQRPSFEGFAWSSQTFALADAPVSTLTLTNYGFSVKAEMSTMRGVDMAAADASVSIVGYYRPDAGCYEARARRVGPMAVEFTLWKWRRDGQSFVSKEVARKLMGRPACSLDTDSVMVDASDDYNYSKWHSMSISMYNTAAGTVVQAGLARYASLYDFRYDRPSFQDGKNNNQRYLVLDFTDAEEDRLTGGTYGIGTANCTGYIGYPQYHYPMVDSTEMPYAGIKLAGDFAKGCWNVPAGRYRTMTLGNEHGKSEFPVLDNGGIRYDSGWEGGLVGLVPQQELVVRCQPANGGEWFDVARVAVTNFQKASFHLEPQIVADSYVKFVTGGGAADVAVDDIVLDGWRGSSSDLEENHGQKDSWVYTDCRIENTVGVSEAYSVQPVPGTNEYCYIFTNAGKTVTFTPRMDIYLSQALVVGGGGAGGWGAGGGGGGGGVYALTNGVWLKAGEPVTVTVGSGGNNYFSSLSTSAQIQRGECGGLSRLSIEGEDYTAYGGGGGASYATTTGYGNNNSGQASVTLATGGGDTANVSTVPTGLSTKMGLGGGGNGGYGGWGAAGAGGGGAGGNGVSCSTNNIEVLDSTHWLLDLECGDGGIGWASDITGSTVYYGGGGGGGDGRWFTSTINYSGKSYYQYNTGGRYYMIRGSNGSANYGNRRPGNGGQGGGGAGLVAKSASPGQGENGANGYGGGGGGGSSWGGGTYRPGGRGGDGAVILRLAQKPSMKCLIQPACGQPGVPMGLRSPLFTDELSSIRFTCDWADANMALQLQVSRAVPDVSEVPACTLELSDNWTTVKTFNYRDISESNGVKMLEYRFPRPVAGLVRLIADPSVVAAALEQTNPSFGLVAMSSVSVTFGTSVRDTLKAGEYFKATLAEMGYDVPTNGTAYSVKAYGLPAGLKLKYNAAVTKKVKKGKKTVTVVVKPAKCEWWIEGVPTVALDYATNPPYLAITVDGVAGVHALPVEVRTQNVTELGTFPIGKVWDAESPLYLPGVTNSLWTVSGLPTGLKYTSKLVTAKKMKGKKVVSVTTNALPYSAYGKATKAGLFTITAKKKKGAYYETMKYRMLVTPKAVTDTALFGDSLTNITTMAYVPLNWNLESGEAVPSVPSVPFVPSAVGGKVAKVAGLPTGLAFVAATTYKDKNKKQVKQYGQTIMGTPTKPGTYVVTFTKNVTTGTGKNKKTVAKTAQILWKVVPNDAELSLGFNTSGGVVEGGSVGLKYGDLLAFSATSNAVVKASGLPKGITLVKLGDGEWGFAGYTAKAGTYLVTVTATLSGKSVTQRLALKVDGLPAWAKGTFNGNVKWKMENGKLGEDVLGLATIAVSSVGKISGKFYEGGTNWTLSATSFTGAEFATGETPVVPVAGETPATPIMGETSVYKTFICTNVVAKYSYKAKEKVKGKWKTVTKSVTRTFALTVAPVPVVPDNPDIPDNPVRGVAALVEGGGPGAPALPDEAVTEIDAWQNLWGSTYKAVGKRFFYTSKKKPYKTFAYSVYTNETGDVSFIKNGETALPGLTYFASLSLKVTPSGAVTVSLSYDTGKTKKDPKTKKTVKVIYKPTCSSVAIPMSSPNADPFVSGAYLFFAPSAANNFPGCAGWAPNP